MDGKGKHIKSPQRLIVSQLTSFDGHSLNLRVRLAFFSSLTICFRLELKLINTPRLILRTFGSPALMLPNMLSNSGRAVLNEVVLPDEDASIGSCSSFMMMSRIRWRIVSPRSLSRVA